MCRKHRNSGWDRLQQELHTGAGVSCNSSPVAEKIFRIVAALGVTPEFVLEDTTSDADEALLDKAGPGPAGGHASAIIHPACVSRASVDELALVCEPLTRMSPSQFSRLAPRRAGLGAPRAPPSGRTPPSLARR